MPTEVLCRPVWLLVPGHVGFPDGRERTELWTDRVESVVGCSPCDLVTWRLSSTISDHSVWNESSIFDYFDKYWKMTSVSYRSASSFAFVSWLSKPRCSREGEVVYVLDFVVLTWHTRLRVSHPLSELPLIKVTSFFRAGGDFEQPLQIHQIRLLRNKSWI